MLVTCTSASHALPSVRAPHVGTDKSSVGQRRLQGERETGEGRWYLEQLLITAPGIGAHLERLRTWGCPSFNTRPSSPFYWRRMEGRGWCWYLNMGLGIKNVFPLQFINSKMSLVDFVCWMCFPLLHFLIQIKPVRFEKPKTTSRSLLIKTFIVFSIFVRFSDICSVRAALAHLTYPSLFLLWFFPQWIHPSYRTQPLHSLRSK